MSYSIGRLLFYLLIAFSSLASVSFAQPKTSNDLGTEVQIRGGTGGSTRWISCYPTDNLVVTKQEFEKLLKDEKCSPLKAIQIDFEKHTLINYGVGGDCFMRVTHKVFRNDKMKTYTVEVKNYWGRCRAGGSHNSWILIDKIPKDYKVELKEIKIGKIREKDFTAFGGSSVELPKPPPIFDSKSIDLSNCVPMYNQKQFVIKDKETYLKNIHKDAQTAKCKSIADNLEFEKFSFLGVQINSGYCRYPKGLQHTLLKDTDNKKYTLDVSYIDPGNQRCRAVSRYDLWIKVPKLQKDFEVIFKITPKTRPNKNTKN